MNEPTPGTTGNNEADSNADTCCLGTNFTVLSYTNRTADVYPYDEAYDPITNVPIVTGATVFHHPCGQSYILVVNEALFYGTKLKHTLLNPNQIRHNGHGFWDNPYDTGHVLSIEVYDEGISIPMKYRGTKLCFESAVPTTKELNTLPHIELTSSHQWNPGEVRLGINSIQSRIENRVVRLVSEVVSMQNVSVMEVAYQYDDPKSDNAIMHSMNPAIARLSQLTIDGGGIIYDEALNDTIPRNTFISTERHRKLDIDTLAENWCIGPNKAKATLEATTQQFQRSAILPISRRYRADRFYKVKRLDGKFSTDTLYADIKSLNQHKYAQIFTHKCGFAAAYPINSMSGNELGHALQDFIHDFGAPEHLTFDGHKSQVSSNTLFMKTIRKYNISHHVAAPRRPEQNPAEKGIHGIKSRWYRIMMKRNVPRRLWDYGLIWVCETGNMSVSSSQYANRRTPLEIITGETPDISEYTDFGFYDWVTYRSNAGLGELSVGKWLGVSHKVGQLMSYWILPSTGKVISCTTVQRLTNLEQSSHEWKLRMNKFEKDIEEKVINVKDSEVAVGDVPQWNRLSIDDNDEEFTRLYKTIVNDETIDDTDSGASADNYINMRVDLSRNGKECIERATVKRRALDVDGRPIGSKHNNPLLDSRVFEVEYDDGTIEALSANVIAENILAQVDDEGRKQLMLDEIIDHRQYGTVTLSSDDINQKKRKTTEGWDLCIQWKDGSTHWLPLKDVKNGYPVEAANYAVRNHIHKEPAFEWWVPHTLKKAKTILSKVKSKYWDRTHKYGIKIPKSVKEAYAIDMENGDKYWTNAIKEEMEKIKGAVRVHDGSVGDLVGYQQITGHMIFDVKLGEGFRRKARYVGDGHKTETPSSVTYSSVVSRDSIRIILTIAALNDLDIQGADIENAYLTAPCREKVWIRGGIEFGAMAGKILVVEKALYGLKSSGAAFRAFLAETIDSMGFKSSMADPDIWLRPAIKADGEEYYEYLICYVDDVLGVSAEAKELLKEIQRDFKLKKDKIEPPEIYLGARLEMKNLNGKKMWTMCSRDYIKLAVQNIESRLQDFGLKLPGKVSTPMILNYAPELDSTPELNSEAITFYQEIIGMLRWAIEIGRVDINLEVSLLSGYQASPRIGHLEQLLHIVAFLKKKPKLTLYFDPVEPIIDETMFNGESKEAFLEHYRDAKEEMPSHIPKPRGRSVRTTAFVDSSHGGDRRTRKSITGYIIFVNRAPIIWYSKRQNTVESSAFSSEFVALKTCVEQITALRFKLRMFGIPISGTTDVLCDNESMVNNSSKIESVLHKKHVAIAYHAVRWAVAAGIVRVGWISTHDNIADAMTKRLPAVKRDYLFGNWTY